MSKDSELIDLSIGYNVLTGSNCSILLHYNKMINSARANIGKRTTNGVLININFINKLKERRDEIFDKDREVEFSVS
jgi:hypothetical protein